MKKRTKGLAVAALGLALIIAGVSYTIVASRANATPDTVVARFYGRWNEELTKGANAPRDAGLHMRSTYVTEAFGREVERAAAKGRDAVLCLGHAPASFTQGAARVQSDGTHASVDFTADAVEGHVLLVRDDRGWWRIDEVDCSAPLPAVATSTGQTS